MLEELLEDDRALIRLSAYETSFHEEVAWIATAPLRVYTMLAVVAQAPGWAQELRSICLECADVQSAYIEKHFFRSSALDLSAWRWAVYIAILTN